MLKKIILTLSLINITSCMQSIPSDQEDAQIFVHDSPSAMIKENEITIQNIENSKNKLVRFFKKHKLLIGIGVASAVSLATGAAIASFYYKNKATDNQTIETGFITLDMLDKQKTIVEKTPRQINGEDNPLYQPTFDILQNRSFLFESQIALEKQKYSIERESATPERQASLDKKILELEIESQKVALKYRFPPHLYDEKFLEKKATKIKELQEKLRKL